MEPTGIDEKQRYVVVPASNVWDTGDTGLSRSFLMAASDLSLSTRRDSVLRLEDVELPQRTSAILSGIGRLRPPGRRKARMTVLDTVAPNDMALVEVTEADRQAFQARFPGLRIVPEIGNDLAWQQSSLKALSLDHPGTAAAAGASVEFTVEVLDAVDGSPMKDVEVAAIVDRENLVGVTGTTDGAGVCTLKLPKRYARLEALVALPAHGHWPQCRSKLTVRDAQAVTFRVPPIDLAAKDCRRLWVPEGELDTGKGVKVAVIDCGVDAAHPDLRVHGGAAFALGLDSKDWGDNGVGHGTHVAGLIAGRGEPGTGIRGVAPGVTLYAYRVFNRPDDQASSFMIAKAIRTAVDEGVDLINLSLGSLTDQLDVMREILRGRSLGVVCVVAVGNDYRKRVRYPAAYPSVIAVSALGVRGAYPDGCSQVLEEVDPSGRIDLHDIYFAGFSNMGSEVDLIAPGVGVVSTYPGGRYAVMDGTSFACPIATGIIARELSRNPDLLGAARDQARSDLIVSMALTMAERCKPGFGPLYEGSGALQ